MDPELAVDGASYCPAFALLDEATDGALGAALGRVVTDGYPEPRPGETDPQWWSVTAKAGVATDDAGRPAHGEDVGVVDLGRGEGVLLVTDQAVACALTSGELRGDAAALVLSFDLDEVVAVEPERSLVRRRVRRDDRRAERSIVGRGRVRDRRRARTRRRRRRRTTRRRRRRDPRGPPRPRRGALTGPPRDAPGADVANGHAGGRGSRPPRRLVARLGRRDRQRDRGRCLVRDGVHVRCVLRGDGRRPRFRARFDGARVRDHAAAVLRHGHRHRPARRPARPAPARRDRRRAPAARPRADVARRHRRRRVRHVRHRCRTRWQPRHRAAVHRGQRMDRGAAGRWRSGCWRPATAWARCCSSRSPSA